VRSQRSIQWPSLVLARYRRAALIAREGTSRTAPGTAILVVGLLGRALFATAVAAATSCWAPWVAGGTAVVSGGCWQVAVGVVEVVLLGWPSGWRPGGGGFSLILYSLQAEREGRPESGRALGPIAPCALANA